MRFLPPIVWLTRLLVGAYPRWLGSAPTAAQRIYFANHSSHMDTVVLWASLPAELRSNTRPVAARDYWDKPGLRSSIARNELNVVLVERGGTVRDPLLPVREALDNGFSLIIFPEGTRTAQALPSEFKSGLFHLAASHPQVELVPVYIENLHRSMPKGALIPVPIICTVRFGAALPRVDSETKVDFLTRARDAVVALAG